MDWRSRWSEVGAGGAFQKSWLLRLRRAAAITLPPPFLSYTIQYTCFVSTIPTREEERAVDMATEDTAGVQVYRRQVDNLLDRAAQVKPGKQIEPPLSESQLGEPIWQVSTEDTEATEHLSQQTRLAAVEIAFREKFYRVLVRPIGSSSSKRDALLTVSDRPQHQLKIPPSFRSGTSSISSQYSPTMVSPRSTISALQL